MGRVQFLSILTALFCFLNLSQFNAQYGNEWIDYDQQYWKFLVAEDGVYTLSFETLQSVGFPVNSIDTDAIQVYNRENEQHIKIVGGNDGTFDPGDYIELLCQKNDGWQDTQMYDEANHQNNPYYSLFNDTISYFITVNDNLNNLRTGDFSQNNYNDYEPQEWCWKKSLESYTSEYLIGNQDVNGISMPIYEEAEGWFDTRFAKGQTRHKNIGTANSWSDDGAPNAKVIAVSASASLASGLYNHHLQVGWGDSFQAMYDTTYYGYQLNRVNFEIPSSQLGNSTTKITHRSVDDLGVATDYHAISYIQIDYAHSFHFEGESEFYFAIDNLEIDTEVYLEITGFTGQNPNLYIIEEDARIKVEGELEGDVFKAIVPFSVNPAKQDFLFTDESNFINIEQVEMVSESGFFTDYTSQQLDSAFVIITAEPLMNAAINYAFYRENEGMDVLLVDVQELYMQYGGGIDKHPVSIRRFCDQLLSEWPSVPSHLFIVGKSIHEMKVSSTEGARNNAENYESNLVPTWGWPASDLMFTSGLAGTDREAAIPTGRLAAHNGSQVLEYLNKVVQHANNPREEWMKNIIHFGGGGNTYEQSLFAGYLNSYKQTAEDTCFGGHVSSFFKTTNDPIQLNLSDSIELLINEGVSLMTFFGHASSTGFDQNIDSPNDYNNQDKYPLLIGNSCYTGNVHLASSLSTSEEFVLVPNRGVIGFIAKGDVGVPTYLNQWTSKFYTNIFQTNYGKSIGQCMVETVKETQGNGENHFVTNTVLTFALHGDPAVRLNPHEKPDYKIVAENVWFEPAQVTSQIDSFKVVINLKNVGKAINGDFGVELIRHQPSGQDSSLSVSVSDLMYEQVLKFTLPVDRQNGIGLNTFDVFVDYPAILIDEMDNVENNIIQGKELLITSGDLIPVYPYQFSIVPDNQVTLKASTGYAYEPEKTYVFQVDTTDMFNSPLMIQHEVTQSGGVLDWENPLELTDGRVYYWRTSPDSINEDGFNWQESSFQYMDEQRGWGQSHFYQFENNEFLGINFNRPAQQFDYFTNDLNLKCSVYGNPSSSEEVLGTRYQIDLDVMDYSGCGNTPAFHVAVIDSITLEPWESNYQGQNPTMDFGNLMSCANDRGRAERYFIFRQDDPDEMAGFVDMINNQVPDGNFLLIYTWQYTNYDGWESTGVDVHNTFANLGTSQIGIGQDSVPFIFSMKKGFPETITEIYGQEIDDFLELELDMEGIIGSGKMQSQIFGPANHWDALYWNLEALEDTESDSTRIRVFGRQTNGFANLLGDYYQMPNEVLNLSEVVDVNEYPYLQLDASLFDFEGQTPAQHDYWRVIYGPAPEAAINPYIYSLFENDSISEGGELSYAVAIENISEFDMDSLLVSYRVEDANHGIQKIQYARQDSLRAGEILIDTISIATTNMSGQNTLWVEINPYSEGTQSYDQAEQYHFNNIAQKQFFVIEDKINPILDVTFDGMHILDRDIVSAKPYILISLLDENDYFIMDDVSDTANFKLFLSTPEINHQTLFFASPEINWIPASGSANRFKIEYTPEFTLDGEYELLVQASDRSGNLSGDADYRINFEVVTKSTITEVMNYPNPFSTRTQFVFTLTGSQVPDYFKIQIMTISGRVVKEITGAELGPLNVGRNRTDYWWDGRDEYGDQLANGIYLYRVITTMNGENIEKRNTGADQYFTKGFGKMYLLR